MTPNGSTPAGRRRGRPRRGEVRPPKSTARIQRQRKQEMRHMLDKPPPRARDHGEKCNAQGRKTARNGDKLPINTADGGAHVCAVLSSA